MSALRGIIRCGNPLGISGNVDAAQNSDVCSRSL